jgi:hypothetical protein
LCFICKHTVEWGWVDFVLKTFNFGEKFRGWIQMLVKNATTSIKTNGFVLIFFSISGSCRQGCPVAPLIYILQPEPMPFISFSNPHYNKRFFTIIVLPL